MKNRLTKQYRFCIGKYTGTLQRVFDHISHMYVYLFLCHLILVVIVAAAAVAPAPAVVASASLLVLYYDRCVLCHLYHHF